MWLKGLEHFSCGNGFIEELSMSIVEADFLPFSIVAFKISKK